MDFLSERERKAEEQRKKYSDQKYKEFLEEYKDVFEEDAPLLRYSLYLEELNTESSLHENIYRTSIKSVGNCTIEIRPNDHGDIPHFHLFSKDGFSGCVKKFLPEPFVHPGYPDTLKNKKSKEDLNNFLRKKTKKGITIWEEIRDVWINANPDKGFTDKDKHATQPDYSKM